MAKERVKHLRRGQGCNSYCNTYQSGFNNTKEDWIYVDHISEATCKTCRIRFQERLDDEIRLIDRYITKNNQLSEEEIFQLLEEARTNADKMIERYEGIINICKLAGSQLMTIEEIREAIKASMCKMVMDG